MAQIEGHKKGVKIATKLIGLIGGVIVFSCAAISIVSLTVFDKKQMKATEEQIEHSAEGAARVMADWLVTLNGYAAISSQSQAVIEGLASYDADMLQNEIDGYTEYLDYDLMAFVDAKGKVLAGGEQGLSAGADLSSAYTVKKALAGIPSYGFEEDFGGEGGFCAIYAYPVQYEGDVVGVAVFGYNFSENDDFISLMQKAYDVECTIFAGDLRVNSTIANARGTKLTNQTIVDSVLKGGNTYKGENQIQGQDYYSIYTPLKNDNGTVVGMLFIAKSLEKIEEIKYITIKIVVPLAIGIVIVMMLVGFFFVRWLMGRIANVSNQLEEMSSGEADLTKRLELHTVDEVGILAINFNKFCDKLQTIIGETKKSKNELSLAGESMTASTQDTASAITQIIANIESISHQINTQSNSVHQTAGAVDEIASNIESLNNMIENQSAGVSQASAAVEEMIGNISSVNNSVEKMATSFDELETNANTGFAKQNDVNERIHQIEEQSQMLQEANAAISNIAEQTNLLAMNAAIEAAHAGEAGKGFAVVADEIRKLSETSSAQSKTIGEQLNNIKTSIGEVVAASNESSRSFSVVSQKIKETDQLVMQIRAAMEEQNQGSQQITEALKTMNDSTEEVRAASVEMANGNKMILEEVQNLQSATTEMKGSMDEMSAGARKINETGAALSDISQQVEGAIGKIGSQIDLFKV